LSGYGEILGLFSREKYFKKVGHFWRNFKKVGIPTFVGRPASLIYRFRPNMAATFQYKFRPYEFISIDHIPTRK